MKFWKKNFYENLYYFLPDGWIQQQKARFHQNFEIRALRILYLSKMQGCEMHQK